MSDDERSTVPESYMSGDGPWRTAVGEINTAVENDLYANPATRKAAIRYAKRRRYGRPGPKHALAAMEQRVRRRNARLRRTLTLPEDFDAEPAPLHPSDGPYDWPRREVTGEPVMYYDFDGRPVLRNTEDPAQWMRMIGEIERERHTRGKGNIGSTVVYHGGAGLHVSTVWLGVDHGWNPDLPPVLWETTIFDAQGQEQHTWRYASRTAAIVGHGTVVAALRAALRTPATPTRVSHPGPRRGRKPSDTRWRHARYPRRRRP